MMIVENKEQLKKTAKNILSCRCLCRSMQITNIAISKFEVLVFCRCLIYLLHFVTF
jgi:hypothetical protein